MVGRHRTDILHSKRNKLERKKASQVSPSKSKTSRGKFHYTLRLENNPLWLDALFFRPARVALPSWFTRVMALPSWSCLTLTYKFGGNTIQPIKNFYGKNIINQFDRERLGDNGLIYVREVLSEYVTLDLRLCWDYAPIIWRQIFPGRGNKTGLEFEK